MRLATCLYKGHQRIVRQDGELNIVLPKTVGSSLRAMLTDGTLRGLEKVAGESVGVEQLAFLPPVTDPDKILCIGFNYSDHNSETGADLPKYPSIFVRFSGSQVGHLTPIVAPSISSQFDFEGELAVVIGKEGWRVPIEDAMHWVAGYTCFAENSVRDFQAHAKQATAGKNFEASGAIGPWLTTADEVPNPKDLQLTTRVNGMVMQHARLSSLVFSIAELIAYISSFTRLLPGDIISTGTPSGVGFLRDPAVWLKPGDRMEIDIPGVGCLANRVISEEEFVVAGAQ